MVIGIICFIAGFATACVIIGLCKAAGKEGELDD